jgi:hypothetical protein
MDCQPNAEALDPRQPKVSTRPSPI